MWLRSPRSTRRTKSVRSRRFRPQVDVLEDRLAPATLVVNTTGDNTTSDSYLTVREAILLVDNGGNANAALGRSLTAGEVGQISGPFGNNDTIQFDSSLTGQTITLGSALPALSSNVAIGGLGAANLAISGAGQYQVFDVNTGVAASLYGLTIDGGGQSVATVLGEAGTTLNLANMNFDASASIAAYNVLLQANSTVARSYQATNSTVVHNRTATFTGSVASLGTDVELNAGGLDLSAATLPGPLTLTTLNLYGTFNVPTAVTVTGSFSANNGVSLPGGHTLTLDGSGVINGDLNSAGSIVNNGTLTVGGYLDLAAGQTLTNAPGGTVQLSELLASSLTAWTFINQGALVVLSGALAQVEFAFVNQATGTIDAQSGVSLTFYSFVTVHGTPGVTTITGEAGSSLVFNGLMSLDSAASLDADYVRLGGTNTVAGTYQANQTEVQNPATFTGTLIQEISSPAPYSRIDVTGAGWLTLAGTLQITLANGFVPQLGTPFTIIDDQTSQSINGAFSNLPEGGAIWDTTHTERFPITYLGGEGNDAVLTATAPLTVDTNSNIMLVHTNPPALTGFVNGTPFTGSITYTTTFGDQVTVTLSTTATSTSLTGRNYTITGSLSGAASGGYFIDPTTSTTGTMYVVSLGPDPSSPGAQAVTFWDNKGDAKLITAADLLTLDALNLVNQGGAAFDPKSVAQLQAWLSVSPNATTAYQLAVQLAAMELNVLSGAVQGTDLVYAGGLLLYATADNIAGLTSGGFIDVQALMQAANAALAQVSPGNPSGDPNQAYEAALTQALQAANGNADFVAQELAWNLVGLFS
jgi:hypothetical protein